MIFIKGGEKREGNLNNRLGSFAHPSGHKYRERREREAHNGTRSKWPPTSLKDHCIQKHEQVPPPLSSISDRTNSDDDVKSLRKKKWRCKHE